MVCMILSHGWLISISSCSVGGTEILHLILGMIVLDSNVVLAVIEQVVCWIAAVA